MELKHVLVEKANRVTTVTINRPQAYNALNAAAQDELAQVFDAFAADDEQWVAIITGAGDKAFCAGHDLKQQAAAGELRAPSSGFGGLTSRFDLNKPVIAAVNGVAMGGGFEIALACDIIVAAEGALFALPEPKVGLAALGGGIHRLPRAIGMKRAMGMMLTGMQVSAEQGRELGFVNEVASGSVSDAARAWADRIMACSPMSVRATKEAALRGLEQPLEEVVGAQWRYPAMQAMLDSADYVEGPAAFAAKRPPVWQGR